MTSYSNVGEWGRGVRAIIFTWLSKGDLVKIIAILRGQQCFWYMPLGIYDKIITLSKIYDKGIDLRNIMNGIFWSIICIDMDGYIWMCMWMYGYV